MKREFTKRKSKHKLFALVLLLSLFISGLSFNTDLFNQSISQNESTIDENDSKVMSYESNSLKNSNLEFSEDNVSNSDIGKAWNVTQYSNATFTDSLEFLNNSYQHMEIPFGKGDWEGYKFDVGVSNLYETKNWINGSFHYGEDDGTDENTENDTLDIENSYQNWTFSENDNGNTNEMSGNYFDSAYSGSYGRDSLELRMDGRYYQDTDGDYWYAYNEGDMCWWETSIEIPRGKVIDSELKFKINPNRTAKFNSWDLTVSLNDQDIYSEGVYNLRKLNLGEWHNISRPQTVWINSTPYTDQLQQSTINLKFRLEYTSDDASYGAGFINEGNYVDYQQLLIDDIELIVKSQVKPTQVNLKMNGTQIENVDWGKGTLQLDEDNIGERWQGDIILTNFSSSYPGNLSFTSAYFDINTLSTYKVELIPTVNHFAIQDSPDTYYTKNGPDEGTKFTVFNNSKVDWEWWVDTVRLVSYNISNVEIEIPSDITVNEVFSPTSGDLTNYLENCTLIDEGRIKSVNIPAGHITINDGSWQLIASSQNYLTELKLYNNATSSSWEENDEYISGDYLNITSKVESTLLNSGYLTSTKANLKIRLPNGSIWIDEYTTVKDDLGYIQFDPIQIPEQAPNYQAGIYEAIITWNNSYNAFGLNQTGLIYSEFTVKHDSILEPSQGIFFYENVFEGNIKNIYVEFKDKIDKTAILEDFSSVYTFLGTEKIDMAMVSAGVYLLEFDSNKAEPGNNTLTIYGESQYYLSKSIQITVEVIKTSQNLKLFINGENRTLDPTYEVPIGGQLNFTIEYFDNNTGEKIENGTVTLESEGFNETFTYSNDSKQYSLIVNSRDSLLLGVNFLNIIAQDPNFETEVLRVKVTVRRIDLGIFTYNQETQYNINPGSDFTLNVSLSDLDFNQTVENASLTYRWRYGEGDLTDEEGDGYYLARLTNVPQGTYTITISAFAGDDYEFEQLEITLVSSRAPAEFMLIQLIATIGIVSALGITGYLYAYQKVLRYPKPVRKVKKFKKSLSKDKDPDISVKSREDAFGRAYQKDLEESTKKSGLASKIKPKISGKAKQEKSLDEITKKATETKD